MKTYNWPQHEEYAREKNLESYRIEERERENKETEAKQKELKKIEAQVDSQ